MNLHFMTNRFAALVTLFVGLTLFPGNVAGITNTYLVEPSLADLQVSSLSMIGSGSSEPAGTVRIYYVVKNTGEKTVSSPFYTSFFYSEDITLSDDDILIMKRLFEGSLSQNQTSSKTFYGVIPTSATAGTRYIIASTDSTKLIEENNEDNNSRATTLVVLPISCYETDFDDETVCSGNGICTATDTCECFENWSGSECATENTCEGLADWAACDAGACFDENCEIIGENDSCVDAIDLILDTTTNGAFTSAFHSFYSVPASCMGFEINGTDRFYTFDVEGDSSYRLTCSAVAEASFACIIWSACNFDDLSCEGGLNQHDINEGDSLDFEVLENGQRIVQVIDLNYGKAVDDEYTVLVEKIAIVDGDSDSADGDVEIADGDVEIADGDIEIADGDIEIADGDIEIADGDVEIADGDVEIADGDLPGVDGDVEIANGDSDGGQADVCDSGGCQQGSPSVFALLMLFCLAMLYRRKLKADK